MESGHIAYAIQCLFQQGVSYLSNGGFHAHMFRMEAKHWRQLCNKLKVLTDVECYLVWKRVVGSMRHVETCNSSMNGSGFEAMPEEDEDAGGGDEDEVEAQVGGEYVDNFTQVADACQQLNNSSNVSARNAANLDQVLELITGSNDKTSCSRVRGLRTDGRGETPTTSLPATYTATPDYEAAWALLDPCLDNSPAEGTELLGQGQACNGNAYGGYGESPMGTPTSAQHHSQAGKQYCSISSNSHSTATMVNGSSLGMGTASNSGSKTGSAPFSIDFAAFRDVLIPIACDVFAERDGLGCTVEQFLQKCANRIDLHGSAGSKGGQADRQATVAQRRKLEQQRWDEQKASIRAASTKGSERKTPLAVQLATLNMATQKHKQQALQRQQEFKQSEELPPEGREKAPRKSAHQKAAERAKVKRAQVSSVAAQKARTDGLMSSMKRLLPTVGVLAVQEATEQECALLASVLGGVEVVTTDNWSRPEKQRKLEAEVQAQKRGSWIEPHKGFYFCWLPSQSQGLNEQGVLQGNAILSRYPINGFRPVPLPGGYGENGRMALICEIAVQRSKLVTGVGGVTDLTVVSLQLDEMAEETRMAQMKVLLKEVRRFTQQRRLDRHMETMDGKMAPEGVTLDAVERRLKRDAQRGSSHNHDYRIDPKTGRCVMGTSRSRSFVCASSHCCLLICGTICLLSILLPSPQASARGKQECHVARYFRHARGCSGWTFRLR
jgi:hypothetical protein